MSTKSKKRFECLGGPLDGKRVRRGRRFVVSEPPVTLHYYGMIRLLSDDHAKELVYYHYYGTTLAHAVQERLRMIPHRAKFWPVKKS